MLQEIKSAERLKGLGYMRRMQRKTLSKMYLKKKKKERKKERM